MMGNHPPAFRRITEWAGQAYQTPEVFTSVSASTGRTGLRSHHSSASQPVRQFRNSLDGNGLRLARVFGVPLGAVGGAVQVSEGAKDAIRAAFGRDLRDGEIRGLGGFPETAAVEVDVHAMPGNRSVEIRMTAYGDHYCAFCHLEAAVIHNEGTGSKHLRLNYVVANATIADDEHFAPKGLGACVLTSSVKAARYLGMEEIHLFGARSRSFNGYYTWPNYGMDAVVAKKDPVMDADTAHAEAFWSELSENPQFSDFSSRAESGFKLQELLGRPGGKALWNKYGWGLHMVGDLRDGSQFLRRMEKTAEKSCFA